MTEKILIDKLTKRIEIQEKIITEDGFGGFLEEWKILKEIWAEINPINMIEDFEGEKINEKITHVITTRYIEAIKNEHRIKYKNRIFNIKGIINSFEENKVLEIKVEEVL